MLAALPPPSAASCFGEERQTCSGSSLGSILKAPPVRKSDVSHTVTIREAHRNMHLLRIALAGSLLLVFCALLPGKTQTLGLEEALQLAARQNPDILLARLDVRREGEHVQVVRDPFSTKVTVGSDPVYTNGYPDTIYTYPNDTNGHSPSIANARIDR